MPNSTAPVVILSDLLESYSFRLAYAGPLLLLSIVATFAGAFLTLDRTRSFAPIDPPPPTFEHRRSFVWRLEGGVGGIIGGWLCGMHLTTYLTLLILNRSSLHLSSVQFLVIWLLCSTSLAMVGSRYRMAACLFYAIIGGAAFTALIDIVFLPKALLPRLVICAVFTPILIVGSLLPHPVIQHSFTRTCSALTGSAGIVISIAVFKSIVSWSNPWLSLAITPIVGTVDVQEKGLSAALCVLAVFGAATDWLLKTKLGEDPSQAWDAYLARYARQLPISEDRAGTFQPYESFWSRLFKGKLLHRRRQEKDDLLFPPDSQLLPTTTPTKEKAGFAGTPPPSFRPYAGSRKRSLLTKRGTMLKVGDGASSSDSSSDDDDVKKDGAPPKFKPWLMKRTSTGNSAASTATTVVGEMGTLAPPPMLGTPTIAEEYSDVEQDVTTAAVISKEKEIERESPSWKPAFLRKHEEELRRSSSSSRGLPPRLTESPTPLSRQVTNEGVGGLAVPASIPPTPSLIRAYDRITKAHQDAAVSSRPTGQPTPIRRTSTTPLDDSFWNQVRVKAGETNLGPR